MDEQSPTKSSTNPVIESIVSWLVVIVPTICFMSIIFFFISWSAVKSAQDFATYEHVTARVQNTYLVHTKSGTYQMSDITFERRKDGQMIPCKSERKTRGASVGDTIEILIQPGSCYEPVIVNGTPSDYIRMMIASGSGVIISFVLSILLIRYAWRQKIDLSRKRYKVEWP